MGDVESEFFSMVDSIHTFRKGNQRAPHKPLYLLFLISSLQQGLPRLQKFSQIESRVVGALQRFGLSNKTQHAHYPFWRLQNDGLAEVKPSDGYDLRESNSDPKKSSLLKLNAHGGLLQKHYDFLTSSLAVQSRTIRKILDSHFPPSIHEDIVHYFNLRLEGPRSSDVNSEAEFRQLVLSAYGNKCAVSGFSLYFRGGFPGLEAAHLCWPQSGGNDEISNGILMTTLCKRPSECLIDMERGGKNIILNGDHLEFTLVTNRSSKLNSLMSN